MLRGPDPSSPDNNPIINALTLELVSSQASGGIVECSSGAIVPNGNVRVTGACTLSGSDTVSLVQVVSGGSLTMSGGTIRKNLNLSGTGYATITGGQVSGNVSLLGVGDLAISAGTVGGSIAAKNTSSGNRRLIPADSTKLVIWICGRYRKTWASVWTEIMVCR